MLTKQMRELKKQTIAECERNGITISQQLIRNKTYAGEQALWVEAWIARKRIPWGGYVVALGCTLFAIVMGWLLPSPFG
jgi:hypothetical protein